MKIQYQLSQLEFISANRVFFRQFSKTGRNLFISLCVVGLFFIALSIMTIIKLCPSIASLFSEHFFEVVSYNKKKIIGSIMLFTFGLFILFYSYRFPNTYFKKWMKASKNPMCCEPIELTIDDKGISFLYKDSGSLSIFSWSVFRHIVNTRDFFILEIMVDVQQSIPKQQLTEEEKKYIEDSFQKYASKKYLVKY